jgi:crotonobetainyl-CoA:carnitine CoA-transferase CaiB-like acyl-CoA transferase
MLAQQVLTDLWRQAGLPPAALDQAELTGADPVLPSSFAVGAAAQASIAAAGLAAAELWQLRGGAAQQVRVDAAHAAVEFQSERHIRVDGKPPEDPWDSIAGLYATHDGWVRLHTNFPHHRAGVLALLGCEGTREAVTRALATRKSLAFEDEAAAAGMCVAALRAFSEWDMHPQALAVGLLPLVAIERIGDAPAEKLPPADRPLAGLRVLDLTRIIAGPVCGRILAAHGAEVMLVTAAHLPAIASLTADTGRGKLSARIDLRDAAGQATLGRLLAGADVFLQGYRPGALAGRGFAPEDAARLRPGIVCASLSAYGAAGPWSGRRGFDSLVQTATGLNAAEAEAAGDTTPRALPAQALDHATGTLLAFGTMAALRRRAEQGGSWQVTVSLARTALWLRSLGRIANGFACRAPDPAPFLEETESGLGRLTAVRHAAVLAATPAQWQRPAMPLGSHAAEWPA